uniref:VP2 n=1 Tax=Ruddy turnstone calicivirus A TaxID=2212768 RepID=A0A3G1RPF7_9CALI|nr:MAG: VP2 [Ruddy turnstone calicivirus A]
MATFSNIVTGLPVLGGLADTISNAVLGQQSIQLQREQLALSRDQLALQRAQPLLNAESIYLGNLAKLKLLSDFGADGMTRFAAATGGTVYTGGVVSQITPQTGTNFQIGATRHNYYVSAPNITKNINPQSGRYSLTSFFEGGQDDDVQSISSGSISISSRPTSTSTLVWDGYGNWPGNRGSLSSVGSSLAWDNLLPIGSRPGSSSV